MTADVQRFADAAALYRAAASLFERSAIDAVRDRGVFSVALAGGSTPKGVYSLLADDTRLREQVPWPQIQFFWGDERHVPPDDPESNFRMAHDALLSRVSVRPEQVHRVRTEHTGAYVVADRYEAEVRSTVTPDLAVPRFDLVLLGLGTDGHTASLFPGTEALSERVRLVAANWVEKLKRHRITMTLPLLNAARAVMFIVAGQEKAEAVRAVLQPAGPQVSLPAQSIVPADGRLHWLLDRSAASLLRGMTA